MSHACEPQPAERDRRRRIRRGLLAWAGRADRQLAWRADRDPWKVLVAEIVAQQTQVERAADGWLRITRAWPTAQAMADAEPGEVVAAWAGLGYNRRAVRLHAAATALVERHDGQVPADLDRLAALPGVGPYTARAVRALAFDLPAAPVDTNVARVLARLVAGSPLGRAEAQRLACAIEPADDARRWTEAMFDFGRLVCTARAPDCAACPVRDDCRWQGGQGPAGAEDPAATGAHRPRPQGAFVGSDRWHRGRLVDALRDGPVDAAQAAEAAGLAEQPDRARAIVDGLVGDGLAEWHDGRLRLPGVRR